MDYPEFTFMRHAGQRHSGCGEEGILRWLFDACHGERGVFVEFGAWDGIHLSNSRFFFERGWSGVFIEGDKKRFWQFSSNYREHPSVKTLCAFVEVEGHNSLDNLLARAEVTAVDLLSIDIDGIDLAIWKSLKTLRPRVVCIEYNVSIPFDTRYESTPHARDRGRGNSALSTYDYAESHHYVLVGVTAQNLIFMDKKKRPDGIDVLDFSQCQECVRLFYPSVKTRVAFSNRGEMFFIEEDGTRHDGEIFYVPCAGFYATQPVPCWLRTDFKTENITGKILNVIRKIVNYASFAVRPWLWKEFVTYKKHRSLRKQKENAHKGSVLKRLT